MAKAIRVLAETDDAVSGFRMALLAATTPLLILIGKLTFGGLDFHWTIRLALTVAIIAFGWSAVASVFLLFQSMGVRAKIFTLRRNIDETTDLSDAQVDQILNEHWGHPKIRSATQISMYGLGVGYVVLFALILAAVWLPAPGLV